MYHVVSLLSERRKKYKQTKNKQQGNIHSLIDSFDTKKKKKMERTKKK